MRSNNPAADPPDGRGGPHAFVEDIEQPALTEEDRHHLARVLRLKPGDGFTVSDGRGAWRPCRFGEAIEPTGRVLSVARPAPMLLVGFSLIKAGRPELVVQKLTELGVDTIVPLVASRSVVQWDEARAAKNHERLQRVAREAAMQSRQVWLPEVGQLTTPGAVAGAVFAEPGGADLTCDHTTVLIGPEGGWTDGELGSADATVSLGPSILRAETAAIAAAVLLVALRREAVLPTVK